MGTNASINSLTASNRATLGKPYPVATTDGALANYGFEMPLQGWATDANCTYQSLAEDPDLVREGMYSLKQNSGGVASQVFKFRNTAGTAPKISVSGWYRSAPGATFRVEAFTTNDLVTPVATSNLNLASAGAWSTFQYPAEDLGNCQVEVIKVSLVNGAGGATYWDNIRFSVDIGDNKPSMRFLAGTENQGVSNPQYVYAVDADNNRLGDRLAGEAKPFYIAYDVTPPTQIRLLSAGTGATTETVDDPTTQFDLRWYTSYGGQVVGPDDPGNANHPTKVTTDTDLLSPWMTYKIYFGTYNTLDVPEGDNPINETTGFVYTNYIVNNAYRTWPSITASSKIEDQSTTLTNYSTLTNMTQTGGNVYSNRVYNLDFDQDYIVVVVGVDKAGNEGPAGIFSWATNNTIKFALTRGWKLPKASALAAFPGAPSLSDTNRLSAMGVAWTAAGPTNEWGQYTMVTKDYDMIYWDSSSFRDSSNNVWQLVGTVNSNWYADDGGQERARGNIRFYRASYRDRWRKELQVGGQTVKQRPLASEEVYAMHNIVLSGGQNFVALHGVPYSNSFAAVFGDTNTFPGGTSASPGSGATVVEFYSPGTNALTSEQYWLNTAGEWWRAGGIEVTHTVLTNRNFFTRGFSIHLPSPLPEAYVTTNAYDSRMYRDEAQQRIPVPAMYWSPILQVPTNNFSQTIYTGETIGRARGIMPMATSFTPLIPAPRMCCPDAESGAITMVCGVLPIRIPVLFRPLTSSPTMSSSSSRATRWGMAPGSGPIARPTSTLCRHAGWEISRAIERNGYRAAAPLDGGAAYNFSCRRAAQARMSATRWVAAVGISVGSTSTVTATPARWPVSTSDSRSPIIQERAKSRWWRSAASSNMPGLGLRWGCVGSSAVQTRISSRAKPSAANSSRRCWCMAANCSGGVMPREMPR